MSKLNIQEEIRKLTLEQSAVTERKALEVSDLAKAKAAEVSSMAIAKALDVSTLAATKAADAASAAAAIAISTGKDLEYMKKEISDTRADVKEIKDRLDNKFVTKPDHDEVVRVQREHDTEIKTLETFRDTLSGKMWGIGIMAGFGSGILMLVVQYVLSHLN